MSTLSSISLSSDVLISFAMLLISTVGFIIPFVLYLNLDFDVTKRQGSTTVYSNEDVDVIRTVKQELEKNAKYIWVIGIMSLIIYGVSTLIVGYLVNIKKHVITFTCMSILLVIILVLFSVFTSKYNNLYQRKKITYAEKEKIIGELRRILIAFMIMSMILQMAYFIIFLEIYYSD